MDNQTFAYILLTAPHLKEIDKMYWGGVIEAFMSCEEQWTEAKDLWPFEWGDLMHRVSVVQLTQGYDPRNDLLRNFKKQGIAPIFRQDLDGDKDNIIYFDKVPKNILNEDLPPGSKHAKRFLEVLSETISLSSKKGLGFLFVGGWGFSFDMNLELEDQKLIKAEGIKYSSRS